MDRTTLLNNRRIIVSSIISDMMIIISFAMLTVYSHLLPFPLYVIEPMRISVIIAAVYLKKPNLYFLAVVLPLISFFISGHPIFVKSLIMVMELNINVFLIGALKSKIKNSFLLVLSSIVMSKVIYYILKYILFMYVINENIEIGKERIIEQIVLMVILSLTYYLLERIKEKPTN